MLSNTRITALRHLLKKLHRMIVKFVKLQMKIEKIPISKKNEINIYLSIQIEKYLTQPVMEKINSNYQNQDTNIFKQSNCCAIFVCLIFSRFRLAFTDEFHDK